MFTNPLSQILELKNKNYDVQLIKSIIMNLNNVNQIEIMALMEIIEQIKQCSNNYGNKEELLNELQDFLQSLLKTDRAAIINTNNFLEYKTKCNSNQTGVIILNHQGQFILSDQLSRNILEINSKQELEQKNFFSLVSKVSEGKLKQMVKNTCLLSNGKVKDSFEVTIYSDRNRKKSLKYLKQMAEVRSKKKIKKNMTEKEVKVLAKEQILMQKYLKSIKVTILKVTILIHKEFIDSFQDSDDIILSNLNTLAQTAINQLAICEVRELDEHIKLTLQELLQDPYISKHEIKWNKKVKNIKGQISDDEEEL
ncbi:unnamed protein product [Paramecium pentaurelia]|uniref:Uncharacterized protein n=1 Tax=Paramecium pentaurelia TaxID=43138 RepID=A0A8S1UNL7_9CILI|nr:unnamed protein product [Paramecium pentaurelia]